ncbi:cell division protein FtsZ [bacterium]|nr:cell division protein FtsZ [bacterium]
MAEKYRQNFELKDTVSPTIHPYRTKIKVFGIGGAGNNTIQNIMKKGAKGIELVGVNTDAQHLFEIQADKKILIGNNITGGLGAGGDPMIGERAAEESKDILTSAIDGTDMLFITCGLGGGTGTGSAPVIGDIARNQGILTVAFVSMPFSEEGIIRWENAQIGLERLRNTVNTMIVLKNDKLVELYPDRPFIEALHAGDELLMNALFGLTNLVLRKGFINLDFADISMVMHDGPNAVIGLGESDSENRIEEAVRRAMTHPMLDTEISRAQSALIHIEGGPRMTLKETREIIKKISEKLDPNARILWGATVERHLRQKIRVILILSGLEKKVSSNERSSEYKELEKESDTKISTMNDGIIQDRKAIFDIKESILTSGAKITKPAKSKKPLRQTTTVFYKIFEEEAVGDLTKLDRAIHFLRKNPDNRRALIDAKQACKLLLASAQMFGFDEIAQLLSAVEDILTGIQSKELQITSNILNSITLAIEMVVDLVENRCDGRGETGYIVDRLNGLKKEQSESFNAKQSVNNF